MRWSREAWRRWCVGSAYRWLCVLAPLGACGGDDPPPAVMACEEAVELGRAGEVTVESFTFEWTRRDGTTLGPELVFAVPPDAQSVAVTVEHGAEWTGLWTAGQPDRPLIDFEADPFGEQPPFFHSTWPAATVVFPSDETSALAPGCLRLRPTAEANLARSEGTLHVVTRRRPPGGRVHLSLVQSGDVDFAGSTFGDVADAIDAAFVEVGLQAPDIEGIDLVDGDPFVPTEGDLTDALRAAYWPEDGLRVVVLLIQGFTDDPFTLGFAGGIPGPLVPGTVNSAVLVSVDGHLDEDGWLDVGVLAETTVHEIGHQLGLFHTTEADGASHDPLEDTPECLPRHDVNGDGELTADECDGLDGRNVMFWVTGDEPQRELSAWQRRLVELSAVTR